MCPPCCSDPNAVLSYYYSFSRAKASFTRPPFRLLLGGLGPIVHLTCYSLGLQPPSEDIVGAVFGKWNMLGSKEVAARPMEDTVVRARPPRWQPPRHAPRPVWAHLLSLPAHGYPCRPSSCAWAFLDKSFGGNWYCKGFEEDIVAPKATRFVCLFGVEMWV